MRKRSALAAVGLRFSEDRMEFAKLSAQDREFFEENGYLVVEDALEPTALAALRTATDHLVSASYRESGRGRASISNTIAKLDEVIPILTWTPTVSLVVQLLSFNIRLTKSHLIYNFPDPPDQEAPAFWHRDIKNSSEDLGLAGNTRMEIKVAYQLSDTLAPESGNTWLSPGSNRLTGPLPLSPGSDDPDNAFEPHLKAGDAFLFENRTFHRAGANRTPDTRKVLMMGYSYAWLSPNDYVVQPDELARRCQDDIQRQLIGALRLPNTQIDSRPLQKWADAHGVQRASEVLSAATHG